MQKLVNIKIVHLLAGMIAIVLLVAMGLQLFTFISFRMLFVQNTQSYFESAARQMHASILTALSGIENTTKTLISSYNLQAFISEPVPAEKQKRLNAVIDNLNFACENNPNIQSMKILDRNGTIVSSSMADRILLYNQMIKDYDLQRIENREPFYTRCYRDETTDKFFFAYVRPIYDMHNAPYARENIAVAITLCTTEIIQSEFVELQNADDIFSALLEDDRVILKSIRHRQYTEENLLSLGHSTTDTMAINNENHLIYRLDIEPTNWRIIYFVKTLQLTADMRSVSARSIALMIVALMILSIVSILLIRIVARPIRHMIMQMDSIGKDQSRRLTIESTNEIGIIARRANAMLDEISRMTEDLIQAQNVLHEARLRESQAKLAFYQSQINPHFLFNSLECIRSISDYHKIPEIAHMAGSMARLFRYAAGEEIIVPLSSEVNNTRDYFDVMAVRYMNKLSITIAVDEWLQNEKLRKMTLQPLVENAIKHGLRSKADALHIELTVLRNEHGDTVILIEDNGKGIEPKRLAALRSSLASDNSDSSSLPISDSGIGLRNIHKRLQLQYGESYGLVIESELDKYTRVMIVLPPNP